MIRDYQALQKTWFIKGHQRKIPTYGKNAGVKLIGTLDYVTGNVYCEEHERYDAKVFLDFLKWIFYGHIIEHQKVRHKRGIFCV